MVKSLKYLERKKRLPKYIVKKNKLKTCLRNSFNDGTVLIRRVINPGCILNDNSKNSLLWWNLLNNNSCSALQFLMKSKIQEQFREMYLLKIYSF